MAPNPRRILLVDDDPVILRGYGQRLRAEGWDVTTAADGFEALNAASQGGWDLILLDLRIPYRNGVEVLRALRARKEMATIPVYLLAQPGDADFVDRGMREGADGVFEKAKLAPRDLGPEVEAIFDGRRRSRAAPPAASAPAVPVPTAVDEIARRFRKDTPVSRSAAMRPSSSPAVSVHSPAASLGGSGLVSHPGRSMRGGEPEVALPPSPAQSVAQRSVAASLGAPAQQSVVAAKGFDVVLNRMVGQSGALAQAVGLPSDYACPICAGSLVLRLEPDAAVEFGVRGHFYCPRCTT